MFSLVLAVTAFTAWLLIGQRAAWAGGFGYKFAVVIIVGCLATARCCGCQCAGAYDVSEWRCLPCSLRGGVLVCSQMRYVFKALERLNRRVANAGGQLIMLMWRPLLQAVSVGTS